MWDADAPAKRGGVVVPENSDPDVNARSGVCEPVLGSDWIASSTFLPYA